MSSLPKHQRGVVAIIVLLALFAVIALAGLALDMSHAGTNKSRMQGVVDAAALAAAKVLDASGDATQATAAANAVFATNRAAFPEMAGAADVDVQIEYSNTLVPFVPGTVPEQYVRVTATDFRMETSLLNVAGVDELDLRASAVAGPSPAIGSACNIAPLLACGNAAAGAPYFGYEVDQLQVMKIGSQGSSPVGPGNFQLLQLGGAGANIVRQNLAGGYQACTAVDSSVTTQTGNVVGPVAQGLNTRFGQYSGGGVNSTDYPPDVVTRSPSPQLTYDSDTSTIRQGTSVVTRADEITYGYGEYTADVAEGRFDYAPAPAGIGAYGRRELAVPIADCSGGGTGSTTLPVLGFGCFYLIQPAEQRGTESYIYGQFISNCTTGGRPGPAPTTAPGPHIIQLYRDQASPDS